MQDRHRVPTAWAPWGLLQPLADGVQVHLQGGRHPGRTSTRSMYLLAPAIALVPAMMTFAVIPFGATSTWRTARAPRWPSPTSTSASSTSSPSPRWACTASSWRGWASNSKYSLLGGVRASAQMISYELALGLSIVARRPLAGTLNLNEIVDAQARGGRLVPLHAAAGVPDLRGRVLRRDQPPALRHAGVRDRARGRLPHRVLAP